MFARTECHHGDTRRVLCPSLIERGNRGALLGPGFAPMEDRLGQAGSDSPDDAVRTEQILYLGCLGAEAAGQGDLRIEVGGGNAYLGAGRMQQFLRGTDVGTLAHQRRWEAYRQLLR